MLKVIKPTRGAGPETPVAAEDPLLALARRAVAGDRPGTHALVTAVGPAVLAVVRKVLAGSPDEVEDIVQEAIEGLLQALPSFRAECTVLHFACRVGVLSALAARRRAAVRAQLTVDAPDSSSTPISAEPSPADGLLSARRRRALGLLLDELPAPQAEVLVLHCALGFAVQEIAVTINRSPETVRSRLRLAKQALRERIGASSKLAELLEVQR